MYIQLIHVDDIYVDDLCNIKYMYKNICIYYEYNLFELYWFETSVYWLIELTYYYFKMKFTQTVSLNTVNIILKYVKSYL